MREVRFLPEFSAWRLEARALLHADVPPDGLVWKSEADPQPELGSLFEAPPVRAQSERALAVPRRYLEEAPVISHHRSEARWALLYRVLWRLTHGEPELLEVSIDADVVLWQSMHRSVKRDMHKMNAFVRFREVHDPGGVLPPHYVAWYRPDHRIARAMAPFFAERFHGMRWSILTEDESVHWDGQSIQVTEGVPRAQAPLGDEMEALWKTYYASTFNPARIKTRAMKKELPVRYWENLPETELIARLLREAPARLQEFYANQPKMRAESWVHAAAPSLDALAEAARGCRGCGLCERATQTVFGEGPRDARIVFVGEQPGDEEDRSGRPFQGPAGRLLERAFQAAGLVRSEVYLTNAVKHFKWVAQGKVRLHQRPTSGEVAACRPWLSAEVKLLRPEVMVCLGVTAAQSVFGKAVTLKGVRGAVHDTVWCDQTVVTTHPAAVLRAGSAEDQEREFRSLVEDLRRALALLGRQSGKG